MIRWDVLDRRLWNGALSVPIKAGLQGRWELRGGGTSWITTVEHGSLRGGVTIWLSKQNVPYPARLILRFDLSDRHIDPEIAREDDLERTPVK